MNYDKHISFEHQGFPVAMMPDHQDDCERWHYAIKIDHKWYDVDYGALSFDKVAADKVIAKVTKQLLEDYRKRTDELFRERDEAREIIKKLDEAILEMSPRHIKSVTMCGRYPCWSVWLPKNGRVERKSLSAAVLEFIDQLKEGAK
jgi:hypothetical protein